MLIQLADFQFSISTVAYTDLSRVSSVRWAAHDIVGGAQRLQAVGQNNDTITLNGVFYPQLAAQVGGAVGTESLDSLRETMKEMQPQLMTAANGNSLGYWVIESLETTDSKFLGAVPRRQEFNIKLRWYGAKLHNETG